jgi:asparagine synthase (glutamine-hydrolysing)
MCGIIGVASVRPTPARGWVAHGAAAMRHRGPDGAGEWWSQDGRVGLGHVRLAIIDLTQAGSQPMPDESGTLRIAFNGEIYNFGELREALAAKGHRFASRSDTEVILAAYREWGTRCLARLNGMFAFAIYDSRRGVVFLARDRAGEKPLFYALRGGELRFASELKGLLADPALERRVDSAALDRYLYEGFVAGEACLLRGVRKLPPAHALEFDLRDGAFRTWRYWRLPEPACPGTLDEEALVEEAHGLLRDAVRRQLVADVPVGVLLSGGVDSSLVTAAAAHAAGKVKTFTVRFPGQGRFDETAHARLIARHFATEHVELETDATNVELLPLLARQYDEPIMDSSMVPTYLLCRTIREHCTVALGGDGGDELFGGYPHHSGLLAAERLLRVVPGAVRSALGAAASAAVPMGFKGWRWLRAVGSDLEAPAAPRITACFDRQARARLMAVPDLLPLDAEAQATARDAHPGDLLEKATRADFMGYLADDILVKVDRASMLASLEVRAPLLDHRMIEFAFGRVPSHLKATASQRKILLKRLARRLLPPEFDQKRKQGFCIPLDSWLAAGPWRRFFEEVLLEGGRDSPFDRRWVRMLLEGQARGLRNGERLFGLALFELWRREYRVSL